MSFVDLDRTNDEDELMRKNIRRLAEEVLRPLSIKLDKMKPRDRVAPPARHYLTQLGN
ncbi:hypothetical protein [Vulcanisaeta souniana]|uniref:hypothetical protein n=1 Tax=Vulcanisaeta souniana TaxID=164452 RepID=UPI000A729508|nr:hypothetical protein [Vulcanisaeta souniana]